MVITQGMMWEMSVTGLFLSIFTLVNLVTKSRKYKTDMILCGLLLLLNIPFIHFILEQLHIGFITFRHYSNPSLNLLYGPLLYLYVVMLVSEKIRFRRSYLLHTTPFVLFYCLFVFMTEPLPIIPGKGSETVPMSPPQHVTETQPTPAAEPGFRPTPPPGPASMPPQGPGPRPGLQPGPPPSQAPLTNVAIHPPVDTFYTMGLFQALIQNFGIINFVSFFAYSLLTTASLIKHQRKIPRIFSQNDNQISLKWIYFLPILVTILLLINLYNELGGTPFILPLPLHLASHFVFIVLLCFFGVKQNPVFKFNRPREVKESDAPKVSIGVAKVVEEGSSSQATQVSTAPVANVEISQEQANTFLADMQAYMEKEKPYLDSGFSAYDFAHALQLSRRQLSYVLINKLSTNFFQYVNEYRVREVKARLEDPQERSKILDIAIESGFNSKSSFNSLFKKHCEVTPSQYRKMMLEKQEHTVASMKAGLPGDQI